MVRVQYLNIMHLIQSNFRFMVIIKKILIFPELVQILFKIYEVLSPSNMIREAIPNFSDPHAEVTSPSIFLGVFDRQFCTISP